MNDKRSVVLELVGIEKCFGDQTAVNNFSLTIEESEFITLLGPSGCGKTTLLRLIAGFEQADSGRILLDGKDICNQPPEKRQVNTVFQSYALFPHMDVYENIAFGLRVKKMGPQAIDQAVMQALEQVRLVSFAKRKIAQLSGGQQQRVAIARAIVNKPRVLLLDEPLSALDARLRKEMQLELKKLQRELGITTILVTHEQDEALSLSDRVVVMDDGKSVQVGSPREIYEEPNNLYVARFIGEINLLPGVVEKRVGEKKGIVNVMGEQFELETPPALIPGASIQVLLRPEDLRLSGDIKEGMPIFAGTIEERSYRGATLDTTIKLDAGPTVRACEFFDEDDPDFDYSIGEKVNVSWVYGWEVLLPDED